MPLLPLLLREEHGGRYLKRSLPKPLRRQLRVGVAFKSGLGIDETGIAWR